jgi:hypothetical protein
VTLVTGAASGIMLVIGAAVVLLSLAGPARSEVTADELIYTGSLLTTGFVYAVLGWLIGTRRPGHVIGVLFLITGFLLGIAVAAGGLQVVLESEPDRYATLIPYLNWLFELVWIPGLVIPFTLGLQFFPDGRLPSRRWRIVPMLTVAGFVLSAGSVAVAPWPFQNAWAEKNPFAIAGSEDVVALLYNLGTICMLLGILGAMSAVLVRFRRARGRERQQMKWLAYTAALGIATLVAGVLLQIELFYSTVFFALPSALGLTIGIAILRHGLFDIDVIIRRTLQYAVISGLLAGVYFGLVVVLTTLLTALGAEGSEVVTVVATLAVAALFAPLRRRVQKFIDRRFYRRKYDAAQLLAAFASSTRDEADLERVAAALLQVTRTAMQPEHVSLWLNEGSGRGSRRRSVSH